MSERHQSLTVILDRDYSEEYIKEIISAINMVRGVHKVEVGKPICYEDHMARTRVFMRVRQRLFDIVTEPTDLT